MRNEKEGALRAYGASGAATGSFSGDGGTGRRRLRPRCRDSGQIDGLARGINGVLGVMLGLRVGDQGRTRGVALAVVNHLRAAVLVSLVGDLVVRVRVRLAVGQVPIVHQVLDGLGQLYPPWHEQEGDEDAEDAVSEEAVAHGLSLGALPVTGNSCPPTPRACRLFGPQRAQPGGMVDPPRPTLARLNPD